MNITDTDEDVKRAWFGALSDDETDNRSHNPSNTTLFKNEH